MSLQRCSLAALLVAALAAGAARAGWLDRVVSFHKHRFYNEVSQLAPVTVKAQIQPKPEGFEDSDQWDYEAALRLLALLRHSDAGRALRRMLRPTRRYKMSMKESMRWFPSIMKQSDHLYYDVDYTSSEEGGAYNPMDAGDQVVVITNPVESRMPSASISVERLKRILEQKAHVLRQMPPKRAPWLETTAAGKETTPPADDTATPTPSPAGTSNGTTPVPGSDNGTTLELGSTSPSTPSEETTTLPPN